MAMDELERTAKSAEDSMLENTLENAHCETFESTHTSIMEMPLARSCERFVKESQANQNEEVEQTCVKKVSNSVGTSEAEGIQTSHICSSSDFENIDRYEESDNRLIPPKPFTCTPLSTNKKYFKCKRSAEKDFRMYDPEHDFFADCPELNKVDGLLKWENIEPGNCESSCTPVSKAGRSAKKNGCTDNIVTPKGITTTPKQSRSRTKKKNCKRNLKVTEVVEAKTGNITSADTLNIFMQGQRVIKDLWKRTENAKSVKRLRQRHDYPIGCGNNSPGVVGISPLPKTPIRFRVHSEDAIPSTQPTTPILDSYERECNSEDFDPTQPSSILVLQDVVAYVEVRSGGDNRSMGVKDQLTRLGATIVDTFSDEVTHVIFKEGLPSTYTRALRRRVPVVSVLWIEACKKAGLRVSERMYPIEEAFTKTNVKPQKKLRKMKSIQPDYDGKVERKKKRVKKDNSTAGESNLYDDPENAQKLKSPKLMSIAEDAGSSGSHTFLKQGALVSDVSTDSDCSPDNLRVIKKKGTKKKMVPPVPKWAKKSFNGNPVVETIVGVGKIRKKDVGDTASACPVPIETNTPPPTPTPTRTHDSPLAMRLLQKVSSPASEEQAPSTSNVGLYDNNKTETASETYVTPVRNKKGKIIDEERGDIQIWARKPFSNNSDTLLVAKNVSNNERTVNKSPSFETPCSLPSPLAVPLSKKVSSPATPSSSEIALHKTTRDETTLSKHVTPIKKVQRSKKQISSDIRNWAIKSFSSNTSANNLLHDDTICERVEENVPETPSCDETPTRPGKSPVATCVTQKIFSPSSHAQVSSKNVEIKSKMYTTPVRNKSKIKISKKKGEIPDWAKKSFNENSDTNSFKSVGAICKEGEVSTSNCLIRLEALNGGNITVSSELNNDCFEAQSADERTCVFELDSTVGESLKKFDSKIDNLSNDLGLCRPSVLLQIDDDEFSSSESDIMIPEVEKCIATVCEDLQKVDEGQPACLEAEVKRSSPLPTETKPKKPQKRKLIPTLDMVNLEPVVVSGITQVDFFKYSRKKRRSSISGTYGSHINRLTPKSSSEPDMRKIGRTVRDRPRVSDDMSSLWKLRKARRKVDSPPLPSLVCTSLHQEDLDLVTSVVSSLGGFKIENKVGPLTTHLIAGGPRRTLNMLFAITRGLWVLRHDWVLHSLEAGYWVDEEKFEMTEFSPVVMKSRIERQNFGPAFQPDLFSDIGSIFVTKDCSPPKEDVEELIRLCGGIVVNAARGAMIVVGAQGRRNEVTYVTAQWVLDSITSGAVQAFDEYLLSQAPT